jgi:hypothetical protein
MSAPRINPAIGMLPSDEWTLVPLHWHAYSQPAQADVSPDAALHHPSAVATWLAERSGAHLWQSHFLIASRGDSIRHNHFVVRAVLNEKCVHGCVATYLATGRRL